MGSSDLRELHLHSQLLVSLEVAKSLSALSGVLSAYSRWWGCLSSRKVLWWQIHIGLKPAAVKSKLWRLIGCEKSESGWVKLNVDGGCWRQPEVDRIRWNYWLANATVYRLVNVNVFTDCLSELRSSTFWRLIGASIPVYVLCNYFILVLSFLLFYLPKKKRENLDLRKLWSIYTLKKRTRKS